VGFTEPDLSCYAKGCLERKINLFKRPEKGSFLMQQTELIPMDRTWDAIRHEPYDDAHQRALQGLPHYWRLSWGYTDKILADCGKHFLLTRVDWLEDPNQRIFTSCPYKDFGGCDG
jgi:hypothetical protein